MTDITIDLTGEDVETLELTNDAGFEWQIAMGGLRVLVTDEQLLALADAVKRWEQL